MFIVDQMISDLRWQKICVMWQLQEAKELL